MHDTACPCDKGLASYACAKFLPLFCCSHGEMSPCKRACYVRCEGVQRNEEIIYVKYSARREEHDGVEYLTIGRKIKKL